MFGKATNHNLKPFIERITFSNTKLDKLERGDLLYFNYSGTREDTIVNPLIIFSGIDTKTGLIQGCNIRNFYVDKLAPLGTAVLRHYGEIYWNKDEDETGDPDNTTYSKRKVNYTSAHAFLYETLNQYKMAIVNKVVGNQRKSVNLMEQYWRSYKPINIKMIKDQFSKLTGSSISVNIEVASAIINSSPSQVVLQPRIE
jgi:hypothetical protein